MSRTVRQKNYNLYRKESKPHRQPETRRRRHADRQALKRGAEPERRRKTSGWLTW